MMRPRHHRQRELWCVCLCVCVCQKSSAHSHQAGQFEPLADGKSGPHDFLNTGPALHMPKILHPYYREREDLADHTDIQSFTLARYTCAHGCAGMSIVARSKGEFVGVAAREDVLCTT